MCGLNVSKRKIKGLIGSVQYKSKWDGILLLFWLCSHLRCFEPAPRAWFSCGLETLFAAEGQGSWETGVHSLDGDVCAQCGISRGGGGRGVSTDSPGPPALLFQRLFSVAAGSFKLMMKDCKCQGDPGFNQSCGK